jgi:mannose-6-phosphate isomerase-like protein (cupin superfamily)
MSQSEVVSRRAAVVRPGEGLSVRWGPAGVIRIIAGAGSTEGSFSICEIIEPPGSGAPLHVHHAEDEAFYVLEGRIELTCGEETLTARAGDFVYAPKDVPHKYVVLGEQRARVLMLFSRPGFEAFFAEGGTPLDQPPAGPPDPEGFHRLVRKYDMELLEAPGH